MYLLDTTKNRIKYKIISSCICWIQVLYLLDTDKIILEDKMGNLLTIKQTSIILNVHWKTIYRWILEKKIKAVQIGRCWKISEEEIEYIKQNGVRI